MRLIDADKIIQWYSEAHMVSAECLSNLIFLKEIIEHMPTVEAQPVIHAHWQRSEDGDIICSHCKKYKHDGDVWYDWDMAYCSHCGAKMDEVIEDEID